MGGKPSQKTWRVNPPKTWRVNPPKTWRVNPPKNMEGMYVGTFDDSITV
jgi:hypothetical protein